MLLILLMYHCAKPLLTVGGDEKQTRKVVIAMCKILLWSSDMHCLPADQSCLWRGGMFPQNFRKWTNSSLLKSYNIQHHKNPNTERGRYLIYWGIEEWDNCPIFMEFEYFLKLQIISKFLNISGSIRITPRWLATPKYLNPRLELDFFSS